MAEAATKLPVKTEEKTAPAPKTGWSPFENLHREIDRLFDNFHPFGWRRTARPSLFDMEFDWPRQDAWNFAPAMDLVEKEKGYEISAELPGMEEKDIEIKLSNGSLTIKGEKSEEKEEREKEYYLSERRYGSFHRSFALPAGIDTDKIDAKFAKGVLTVTLPKTKEARSQEKKIGIKAE
ncbi:Hsp20/alpha crystallin family protein [Roseibium litorale]|uniref:Hsp20/alpha crystallin family protein n=1 Tax=Roseibium litorale TaxID=2803841 RepID=A0ABR9CPA0_9HYPH|nr:Hsp20/alpha crystallin family protein [Roseibium litorale]MBD8892680.1 Hsp20/alpha crystallin family protein [Roseibium litorale]